MTTLPYRLDRTVVIQADADTVFRYFTDSARWAQWWGKGSTIEARPGGRLYVRHPNGIESAGEVLEIDAPARIVFTYGFVSGNPRHERVRHRLGRPVRIGHRILGGAPAYMRHRESFGTPLWLSGSVAVSLCVSPAVQASGRLATARRSEWRDPA